MSPEITVYVRQGDPASTALLRYLDTRGIDYTRRDIDSDPSAQAVLFGRLGRVVAPVTQVGEVILPGFDPLQLARFMPTSGAVAKPVSFGAAVRTATAEVARAAGLAAAFGVEVGPVQANSPAAQAGIEVGDVISAIGAYTLTGGRDQFAVAVAARAPGDSMSLTVHHHGVERVATVVFPAAEPSAPAAVVEDGDPPNGRPAPGD